MSLLLQLLLLICVLGAVSAGSIVEPQTKHVFSENDSGLSLAGVGVRVKQIGPIKAKVYAAGFYVDKNSVKSACSGSTCKTSSELAASSSFNNAVTDPKNKNIILKMARTVGAETMVAALADSVKPAMGGKDTTKLKEFEGILLKSLKDTGAKNGMVFKFKSSSGIVYIHTITNHNSLLYTPKEK